MLRAGLGWVGWLTLASVAHATTTPSELSVVAVARQPDVRTRPAPDELSRLRQAVEEKPRQRDAHFALTRALIAGGDLTEAHRAATRWRQHDAYNLVVVRLLGDIETELGDASRARRTYSSIVELVPRDVQARRALATVLKQAGDLPAARVQLVAALELAADHHTSFELGDVEQRLGLPQARARFRAIADAADAPESLRYPARQRLAQLIARERLDALQRGDEPRARELLAAISELRINGGVENDIKVFLSWDTDRTDIDLWVQTPAGDTVMYSARRGRNGEQLFDDVTSGYGPESFTAKTAAAGNYTVLVDYFGARPGAFKEARGEVIVILNEGRPSETRQAFPYRLFAQKDRVTVAKIHVRKQGS